MKIRKMLVVLGTIFVLSTLLSAGGESGMIFMRLSPDARGNSLAGSIIGNVDTLSSLVWNPAGLAKMTKKNVQFSYTRWIADMNHIYLAYGMPLVKIKYGKIATSLVFFSQGLLDQTTGLDTDLSGLDSYDLSLTVGYGKTFGSAQIGGSLHYITSKILGESLSGMALDFGTQYAFDKKKRYKAGFVLKNVGFNTMSESMPMLVQLGFGAKFLQASDIILANISGDYVVAEQDMIVRLGMEYGIKKMVFLRAGYKYESGSSTLGGVKGLTLGIGGNFKPAIDFVKTFNADITWIPVGELGNSVQFTIGAKF